MNCFTAVSLIPDTHYYTHFNPLGTSALEDSLLTVHHTSRTEGEATKAACLTESGEPITCPHYLARVGFFLDELELTWMRFLARTTHSPHRVYFSYS